ncbi:Oxidoreductase-like domain-containing protein 1 [Chionoecetes opilio]|uniref:Oxidoreductase-like domain-containing protein 1 n=1 Tax=Chionoecetes opilio TaxID=41210 RepID=A0A8J4YKZ1_CHIOP|nr:Oxidoreductase-like domain-containing protein 1 [Chionoecetes opilio]
MFARCCLHRPTQKRCLTLHLPILEHVTRRTSYKPPPPPTQGHPSSRGIPEEPPGINPSEAKDPCHELLIQPTTCCGSGCANCVWVEYAERLADHYCDGGHEAQKMIEREVTDPSLKAYILMEVRLKARQKK